MRDNYKLSILAAILLLVGGICGCLERTNGGVDNSDGEPDTGGNIPPTCSLSANVTLGYYPLNVTFNIFANDTDGEISFWVLDADNDGYAEISGEGTPPPIFNYVYQISGRYDAVLKVSDNNGTNATDRVSIFVKNHFPIAVASANPISGEAPLTVHFTGSGNDKDGVIELYKWSFGDGTSSEEQNPTHIYSKTGTFHASLCVYDDMGGLGGCTIVIQVVEESESTYKNSCRDDITFEQLNSDTNTYRGQRVTYRGQIDQVIHGHGETYYRIDVGNVDIIYVTVNGYQDFVEDEYVQIWGEVKGSYTYESIAGYTITLPHIEVEYIEEVNLKFNVGEKAKWTDLEVTVRSAQKTNYYTWTGSSGTTYTEYVDEGKIFVIIDVKVKQTGTGSEYISPGDFWIVTLEGYKYDYDSGTYSMDGGLESTTLYQNQITEGKILFEIPETSTDLTVQFNFGTSYNPLLAEWTLNI